jgi:glutaryl-CoA dehydrogenase (non-decarboxylating)
VICLLSPEQQDSRRAFRAFADEVIEPGASRADQCERLPDSLIQRLAQQGFIAAPVAKQWGGTAMDPRTYGLLTEQLGRTCQSVRNFVGVQDMVATSIEQWAAPRLKERWLASIAAGRTVAAFALTEPDAGSAIADIATTATPDGDGFVLHGRKKWISFGQIAAMFLVFAQCPGGPAAFLVERDRPGLAVEPASGLLGLRASMLAGLILDGCRVPADNMVGRVGAGLAFVAATALDLGRYSTAWGAVGLAQACLEDSLRYADVREQGGRPIRDHELVQRMLADLITDTSAARLLCHYAGVSRMAGDPDAPGHTLIAKYRAATVATHAASSAVQIHGANGIGGALPVQRRYRDAKVLEIIEGTTQIQQVLLGQFGSQLGGKDG